MRVVATAETLTVRNLLRTHILPWDAIAGFDLAVRIVLEDPGDDLPDRKWAVPSRARHHWQLLFAHWRDRRAVQLMA